MKQITRHRRAGFTVVELLVVITVIVFMISLLVSASMRFVVSARESATTATINKASGVIQDRVRAFKEFDFSDAGVLGAGRWNITQSNGGYNDFISNGLAEVLFRKGRFKSAFPQAFSEFTVAGGSTPDTAKLIRFFGTSTIPPAAPYDSKYESGIVLYALIMKGETFGAATPAEDIFTGAEVINNPQTGGLPCLVDAWGQPLVFYRWPTRLLRCGEYNFNSSTSINFASPAGSTDNDLNNSGHQDPGGWVEGSPPTFSPAIRPNSNFPGPTPASLLITNLPPFNPPPNGVVYAYGPDGAPGTYGATSAPSNLVGCPDTDDPESLNTDPDDPSFQLSAWLFDSNSNLTPANLVSRRTAFVSTYHDFYTFHTPLIVSAGQDRQLGLYLPNDYTSTCGYLAAPVISSTGALTLQPFFDNITNLNQRPGGK